MARVGRRVPGGAPDLRHRGHRVPGHCAGRARPADDPRCRGRRARPIREASVGRSTGAAGGGPQRLLRSAALRARGPLRPRDLPAIDRGGRRRRAGRPGARRRGAPAPRMLRRGRPLGGDGQLRRPARPGGRGQPPRAHPGGGCAGRGVPRAGFRHPPPDLGLDRIRGRHPPGRGPGGAARREPLLASTWIGRPRSTRHAWPAATCSPARGNARGSRDSGSSARERARRSRRPPAGRPLGAPARGVGEGRRWSGRARHGPSRSGGRTPTPLPRPSASVRWSAATDRGTPLSPTSSPSPSSGRRSSSRRSSSRVRGGSGAFGWPSRSSSPTPADCCGSSRACPRGSSTSSRWTWSSPRSSRPPPGGRPRSGRRSSTSPPGCAIPCAYGRLVNSSSRNGSAATRSTTSGASRSPSRTGRSPGAAASNASSAGPPGSWTAPSAPCVRCRYEGGRRRGRPSSRTVTTWPDGPSAMSSSTAPTPRPRPVTGWTVSWRSGRRSRRTIGEPSPSTRPPSTGAHYIHDVHLPSIVRARPGPHLSRAFDASTTGAPGPAGPCSPRIATWPCSTSSTRSSPPTSWIPTPGWRPAISRPPGGPGCVAELLREAPSLLALDRRDRSDFLRFFYRRYEGASVAELEADAWDHFHEHLLPRSFPDGIARVREHRRLGHRTLLITGALDFVVEPHAPAVRRHRVRPPRPASTGATPASSTSCHPPVRHAALDARPTTARSTASISDQSVAYADSASDLAMLEAVGFPVAVNPEARLSAASPGGGVGRSRTGPRRPGAARPLPLGPLDRWASSGRTLDVVGPTRQRRASGGGAVKGLVFERSLPRFAAARLTSALGSGRGAAVGPLRLADVDPPALPGTVPGTGCGPCCRGSAARTWPRWTAAARATSRSW